MYFNWFHPRQVRLSISLLLGLPWTLLKAKAFICPWTQAVTKQFTPLSSPQEPSHFRSSNSPGGRERVEGEHRGEMVDERKLGQDKWKKDGWENPHQLSPLLVNWSDCFVWIVNRVKSGGEWVSRWMDRWIERCMDGQTNGWMDGWVDVWMHALTDGQTESHKDECMNRWKKMSGIVTNNWIYPIDPLELKVFMYYLAPAWNCDMCVWRMRKHHSPCHWSALTQKRMKNI